MIPTMNIVAWSRVAPWAEQRQIEQDLIICRAIVDIFGDPFLQKELRLRGGTALNKLHFSAPLRYSEDLDLVRASAGPIKPILQRIRQLLEPWLGEAAFDRSPVAPKLRFRTSAEDGGPDIRLKIEINIREIEACDPVQIMPLRVDNPWFAGKADVATFSREEMVATKLRALLQRDKGRDLFDLAQALDRFKGLNTVRAVEIMGRYGRAGSFLVGFRRPADQQPPAGAAFSDRRSEVWIVGRERWIQLLPLPSALVAEAGLQNFSGPGIPGALQEIAEALAHGALEERAQHGEPTALELRSEVRQHGEDVFEATGGARIPQ
jgi:predicted nucleotidyltransferase component of viral defense system